MSNIYCVFLQSILLQLNNMSKYQQPTEHLAYKRNFCLYAFNKNTSAKTTRL